MSVSQKLQDDIKIAMKSRENEKLQVLRTLHSDIRKFEIDGRKEASDDDIYQILAKGIKTRQESADQYKTANRQDLAKQEEFEIEIYKLYQPEQFSEDEIKALVADAVAKAVRPTQKILGR